MKQEEMFITAASLSRTLKYSRILLQGTKCHNVFVFVSGFSPSLLIFYIFSCLFLKYVTNVLSVL